MPTLPTDEGLPRRLGRTVLVQHLATGGMGSVYLALQSTGVRGLERPCVVKTVRTSFVENRAAYTRFIDEARTSLMLHHRNLCTTFDVDEVDGTTVLAMEYIAGRNLRQVFERIQQDPEVLTAQEIVAIAAEALEGLEHAHNLADPRTGQSLGLVHRDISPQNIMISFDGDVKVIDFGVARSRIQTAQTARGAVVGKVSYMAAEQITGGTVDRRADVACLAIVLIELLTGVRYYGDLSLAGIWAAWGNADAFQSEALERLPPGLRLVLERAVATDPAERFGSAGALKEALIAVVGLPRSGALKQAMARLFPGAEEEARAALRDVYRQAEAFYDGRTPSVADRRVSADADTMRVAPVQIPEVTVRVVVADLDTQVSPTARPPLGPSPALVTQESSVTVERARADSAPEAAPETPPATAPFPQPARPPQQQPVPLAALIVGVLAVSGVMAWAFFPDKPVDTADNRDANDVAVVVDAGAPAVIAAAPLDAAPLDAAPFDAGPFDAGLAVVATPIADAGFAPVMDAGVAVVQRPRTRAPVVVPPAALPPRPRPLGERLRYLTKHCTTRAARCTKSVSARQQKIASLSPQDIAVLSTDADRCLDVCGAPR